MKAILKYLIVFSVVVLLMTAMLVGVAMIPKNFVQTKSEESADYLLEKNDNFYNLIGKTHRWAELRIGDCTKVDLLADTILLSIAYYLDQEHPLESVLWAHYYNGQKDTEAPLATMYESYERTIKENPSPNEQYLRYWHGSLIFVRPLLMVFNLKQIKFFHAFVILALSVILFWMLKRRGLWSEIVCFSISMVSVSIWIVPMSLDYTWMFLIMLVASIIIVKFASALKYESLYTLFFLTGMFTAYIDFLTTETITLLIPLLLSIKISVRLEKDRSSEKQHFFKYWKYAMKSMLLWGIGYVGAWLAKWIISAVVLHINPVPYIMGNVVMHLGGYDDIPVLQELFGCLFRNAALLFPWGYGVQVSAVVVIAFAIIITAGNRRKLITRRQNVNWQLILLYAALGTVVYIRFLVLRHHSWYHYFFTFRAQAAGVLALCFIMLEILKIKPGITKQLEDTSEMS